MKKNLLLLFLLVPLLLAGLNTNYDIDGAVGYWSLGTNDAVSTAIFDGSGSKNDGVSANTPVFTTDQNGVSGQAMVFNGTTDQITTPLTLTNRGFTLSCWAKLDDYTGLLSSFIGDNHATLPYKKLWFGWDVAVVGGSLALYLGDGTTFDTIYKTGVLTDNDWHFYVVTVNFDASTVVMYFDGTSVGALTGSSTNLSSIATINLAPNYKLLDGNLSDPIIYSEAKSADWVASQYLAGQTTAGIVADGSSVITNGDFSAWNGAAQPNDFPTDWALLNNDATNYVEDSNGCHFVADAANLQIRRNGSITVGNNYKFDYEITQQSAGSIRVVGFTSTQTLETSVGVYTFESVATQTYFYIRSAPSGVTNISIDNVVVTDITNQRLSSLQTGLVFDSKMKTPYIRTGKVLDISPNVYHGTPTNVTTNATHSVFNGTSSVLDYGDIGTAKTLSFWINLDSTTESILEETAGVGVSVSSGTMSYGSWDNCFIDGIDTDTIATGWCHVTLTSTTNVTLSAFRIGLITASYLGGDVADGRTWTNEQSNTLIIQEYNRLKSIFD